MLNWIYNLLKRNAGASSTQFQKLNADWNAHPVDPNVVFSIDDGALVFEFTLNHYVFPRFTESQRANLIFDNCSRYRIGSPSDEGWFRGQCRFSTSSHRWGEFYEVTGDSLFAKSPDEWEKLPSGSGTRHFLFYMKDDTFECTADGFQFHENAG